MRQLRQVLMYWPASRIEPYIKLSLADDPISRATRNPDAVIDVDMPRFRLVVYYWGKTRDHGEIVQKASWDWSR